MVERPRWKQKGGRLPKHALSDLGMNPAKKAASPDPEKLLEEIRFLAPPAKKLGDDKMRRKPHMRSRRRRH